MVALSDGQSAALHRLQVGVLATLEHSNKQDPRQENGLQKPPKCVAYPLFHLELDLTFFSYRAS